MSALAVPEATVYDVAKFEEWKEAVIANIVAVDTVANLTPFVLGDLINAGVQEFGEEKAYQIFDPNEHPVDTLTNWAWVADRFPQTVRRPAVKFTVYQSLAGIKEESKRFDALTLAIESGWTREDAREYVKSLKGKPEKEKPETISLEKAPLLAFFDEVQKVLDTAKVSKHTQAVEHYLNSMVDRKVWGA